jgi:hypothetical protein
MSKKLISLLVVITLISLSAWTFTPQNPSAQQSSVPGLPFTEDFADTALRDADETNANWSIDEEALILNWRQAHYGVFEPGLTGADVSSDTHNTRSIALGDVDGDGDLDLVAGNAGGQTNRLYLNEGTADPFSGVIGSDISSDVHDTYSVALGDVDGDGDLDLLAGNRDEINRLYLNNGSADPFSGVTGSDISSDTHGTLSIELGDVDGDGDLDLVVGNHLQRNRLYLNNGSADPFSGVTGSDISGDAYITRSIGLGDMDGDGDLDLVTGTIHHNRLYLNNGTADPFSWVIGAIISLDTHWTQSVTLGDVDGDGDLDLVAGNDGQPNRLYLNNGTAAPFSGVSGSDISSDPYETRSIALGDVDGDGDLDLAAGNGNQPNRLYLNNGTADPFSGVSGSDISSDAHSTTSIALGDIDGDGNLDLVAGNISQSNRLYLNEGTSNPFNGVTGSDISSDAHETRSIALGDVDGDGDLDLVVGNHNSQTNRLYLNNGTAAPFSGVTGADISSDAHKTRSVALGDVDGDGDLDLVAGNWNQTNRLYLNNGTAAPFSGVTGADISSDAHASFSIALGDVDGDGDLDLVAGNVFGTNRLYLNNGSADPFSGVSGANISSDAHETSSIALGDMDGDGDLDLVEGNDGQTNRLYLNNDTADPFNGVTGADISSDTARTLSIALGDVDGDGDLDLVAGNWSQANRLYLNNSTADPFSEVTGANISSDTHWTQTVALGDVDGDGDLDVLVGNNYETNRLYLNTGTANPFSGVTGSNISSDTHNNLSIALGDVDGDGDLDLVEGNIDQINCLYLNRHAASPFSGVAGADISSDTHNTYSIALGDVDGDGDLDLVAGNSNQTNRLYLNNGTADPFSGVSGANISSDAHSTWSIALGDVNGDGDLDLVAGNSNQTNRLYLNNGTADPFSGVTGADISSDAHVTTSIALADVDGDGDLDLVAGNATQINRLYLNNGTADPFSGVGGSDISSDAHWTYSIALGDVDGDGDLDLVEGNYFTQTNHLYLNNGTPNPFSGVIGSNISSDTHNTDSIALGDTDRDGDLDLVVGNFDQTNRLYLNNGTADPFSGVTGANISSDTHSTWSIALGDVNGDGDLDLVVGNYDQANRLYLNNGTAAPFSGVAGSDISGDAHSSSSVALGDMDRDGDLDLAEGNDDETNRLYLQRNNYHTTHGLGTSLRVDTESSNIAGATLTASVDLPINTQVTYYMSNNGGTRWYIVRSGVEFTFPSTGMDLRWKAELESLSPILTPRVNEIQIEVEDTYQIYLPLILR